MRVTEQTVKCHICGKPYVFMAFYAGDQSACPSCRAAARKAVQRPSTPTENERRRRYFGTDR